MENISNINLNEEGKETGSTKIIYEEIIENVEPVEVDDELDAVLSAIPTINFIEANNLKRNIEQELQNLKSAKDLIDAIRELESDPMNRKIMEENILESEKIKSDSKKFMEDYEKNSARLNELLVEVDKKIEEYDDIPKTTSFLTRQLVQSIDKRLENMKDHDDVSLDHDLNMMETTRTIYQNRDYLGYIRDKASYSVRVNKCRKEIKNHKDRTMKKAVKKLAKHFSQEQLEVVEKFVFDNFQSDRNATDLFLVHMSEIIESEKRHGNHTWVKVMMMNMMDINAGIYDLDGGPEYYIGEFQTLYEFYK